MTAHLSLLKNLLDSLPEKTLEIAGYALVLTDQITSHAAMAAFVRPIEFSLN